MNVLQFEYRFATAGQTLLQPAEGVGGSLTEAGSFDFGRNAMRKVSSFDDIAARDENFNDFQAAHCRFFDQAMIHERATRVSQVREASINLALRDQDTSGASFGTRSLHR